jgi:hypothetical protein
MKNFNFKNKAKFLEETKEQTSIKTHTMLKAKNKSKTKGRKNLSNENKKKKHQNDAIATL